MHGYLSTFLCDMCAGAHTSSSQLRSIPSYPIRSNRDFDGFGATWCDSCKSCTVPSTCPVLVSQKICPVLGPGPCMEHALDIEELRTQMASERLAREQADDRCMDNIRDMINEERILICNGLHGFHSVMSVIVFLFPTRQVTKFDWDAPAPHSQLGAKHVNAFEGINPGAKKIKGVDLNKEKGFGLRYAGAMWYSLSVYDIVCDLRRFPPSRSKGSVALNCKLSSCAWAKRRLGHWSSHGAMLQGILHRSSHNQTWLFSNLETVRQEFQRTNPCSERFWSHALSLSSHPVFRMLFATQTSQVPKQVGRRNNVCPSHNERLFWPTNGVPLAVAF